MTGKPKWNLRKMLPRCAVAGWWHYLLGTYYPPTLFKPSPEARQAIKKLHKKRVRSASRRELDKELHRDY
jgi:hypothetical protein